MGLADVKGKRRLYYSTAILIWPKVRANTTSDAGSCTIAAAHLVFSRPGNATIRIADYSNKNLTFNPNLCTITLDTLLNEKRGRSMKGSSRRKRGGPLIYDQPSSPKNLIRCLGVDTAKGVRISPWREEEK